MGLSDNTRTQEAAAIEDGFRQAITSAFIRYYEDTNGDHTKWGDGAIIRFRRNLANARIARASALKVIEE